MTEKKFDELWQEISNVATDIVNSCNDGTTFNPGKKDYIKFEYEKLRDDCKNRHFKKPETADASAQKLLDRHKVAACIAGAIVSASPLALEGNEPNVRTRLSCLANETLAFLSALGIVKSFISSDQGNSIGLDIELKKDFLSQGFIFPSNNKNDYMLWLLFLLQECSKIGFNVLSFSNILYLLEEYTFSQLEIKRLQVQLEAEKQIDGTKEK